MVVIVQDEVRSLGSIVWVMVGCNLGTYHRRTTIDMFTGECRTNLHEN